MFFKIRGTYLEWLDPYLREEIYRLMFEHVMEQLKEKNKHMDQRCYETYQNHIKKILIFYL